MKKANSSYHIFIGNRLNRNIHLLLGKMTGFMGCFSWLATKKFLSTISNIKPDIIHLHNLHNGYINLPMLFSYIKKNNIKVVWTLHDCWAFTAQCPHFTIARCEKWKNQCHHCPQYKSYPQTLIDCTRRMYKLKRKWFTGIKSMTIVTPSNWLSNLVKQSFLKDYSTKVLQNGIDLNIFKPIQSDFRKEKGWENKFIILGVALGWEMRKGLDVFIKLAEKLDTQFQIILVGTTEEIDKVLPANIYSIHRTQNQQELARIYSAADVFVNPTREENYPTVNMEAVACGTPVITFNTGGSAEMLDESCGIVVECNDIEILIEKIKGLGRSNNLTSENCLKKSKSFDATKRLGEYISLYKDIYYEN